MRIGRYHARELLRLIDGVGAGASAILGGQSLASEIARERLERVAYGKQDRPAPTVTFPDEEG